MKKTIQIIVSLLLFLIGGFIYLGYRSKTLLMFEWAHLLNADNLIDIWRQIVLSYPLPDWVVYCLPDGLWLLSYMLLIDVVWKKDIKGKSFWLYILPFLGIMSELLQIFFPILGTFDIIDLLCYIFAVIIYFIITI